MIQRLIRQFTRGAGGGRRGGRAAGHGRRGPQGGSTGARIGAAVERFLRRRR